jgi:hypothetical protein
MNLEIENISFLSGGESAGWRLGSFLVIGKGFGFSVAGEILAIKVFFLIQNCVDLLMTNPTRTKTKKKPFFLFFFWGGGCPISIVNPPPFY